MALLDQTNRRMKMLLEGENAIIYGGGGAIGVAGEGATTGTVFNLTSGTVVD